MQRNLSNWQRSENKVYLEEARLAAEAVNAIVNAIVERNSNERII